LSSKIKKVIRYITIYGFSRTFFKVAGRISIGKGFSLKSSANKDIAVIGCGQFGFSTIGYFIRKNFGNRFAGCYDVDPKNKSKFEKFFDTASSFISYEELVKSDAVKTIYIASNHSTHTPYALEAIRSKKTVYIEKPISVTHEQFKALIETSRECGAKIFAGYNRPFSSAINDLRASLTVDESKAFTISYFISGHMIPEGHWYRDPNEGTRICGNVGHWLDLSIHMLAWRNIPQILNICLTYSNIEEPHDNIVIAITSENGDLISIVFTSRCEPFEGVNESVNFQHNDTIAKIDDFRKMTLWQNEKLLSKKYWPKDVGHEKAILQPFNDGGFERDFAEIEYSTLLMLFIMDMVKNRDTNKLFDFKKEWSVLFGDEI
jgi:predicted dehydrogenase